MKFSEYFINELKLFPEKEKEQTDIKGVKTAIGGIRFRSLTSHPWYKRHTPGYAIAYKHGVDKLGYHEVEVYPWDPILDKVGEKVRPRKFIRFHFAGQKVTQAHLFRRGPPAEDDAKYGGGWHYVSSYNEES